MSNKRQHTCEGNILEILEILDKVAEKIAPGRLPSFSEAQALKTLEEISLQKGVGRLKLSKSLNLGEGEVRTLIKHLKNEKLIEVSKSGIVLSERGRKLISDLRTYMSQQFEVPSTPLTIGSENIAIRITGMRDCVRYGLEQRDAAIMAGAKGATTLAFSKGKLTIAGTGEEVSKEDAAVRALLSKTRLNDGDVIIIGSADEKASADLGAKMAAIRLLDSKFKNK